MQPTHDLPDEVAIPFVSVVVPVYNRARHIAACLSPLLAQTYPPDRYEIILVDDGSTDNLGEVARASVGSWSGSFRCVRKANGGPASARNAGIRASQGTIIAFTDSDCVVAPDWLASLVGHLAGSDAAAIGGPIRNVSPPGWVAGYLESGHFYRHRAHRGQVNYLLTANVAFRRSALAAIGGFMERRGVWGEDADLSFRLKQAGYRLDLSPTGEVTHCGTPVSVRALVNDLFRYGCGNYVLSANWTNGRTPVVELLRHGVAFEMALWLALWRARRVGLAQALTYWPLILIEHASFIAGMLSGVLSGSRTVVEGGVGGVDGVEEMGELGGVGTDGD